MSRLNELSQSEIDILESNITTLPPLLRSVINHVLKLAKPDKEDETRPRPKFKVGDKVMIRHKVPYMGHNGEVGVIDYVLGDGRYGMLGIPCLWEEKYLVPYAEQPQPNICAEVDKVCEETANRLAEQLSKMNREITQNAGRLHVREGAIKSDYKPQISLELDYTAYRMELAAKIAIAYAEKGRYEPSEIGAKAVEVANGVVEQLKNSKI